MRERLLRILESDTCPWICALLAFVMGLPSLRLGLQADDHVLGYQSRLGAHPLALFTATPDEIHLLREVGSFAWWTSPHLELAFFRPLSSLTHMVEFRLWPNATWAMHLSSVAVYAALVAVAALLYRELLPSRALAGLASLMFAIDEAHASAVGWIASRNTLLAGLFALLSLLFHVRGRARARPGLVLASALALGLALMSGEAGIAGVTYLVAYALVLEPGRSWQRLTSIAPQLAVFAVWATYYVATGGGVRGSSWYHELNAPLALLREGMLDSPLWLLSLFGPSPISAQGGFQPWIGRTIALCLVLPVLAGLWFLVPRSKLNAFFGLAMLLGAPALFATIPQERVTLALTFAAFGWIVSLLAATADTRVSWVRWYRRATLAVHLGLPLLLFVGCLNLGGPTERGTQAMLRGLPSVLPNRVVVVNLPVELLTMYTNVRLGEQSAMDPHRSMHQLYAGSARLTATRIAPDTLELRATPGWGQKPIERIFCAERDLPRAGAQREVADMRIRVEESDANGAPTRVRFQFASPLEATERAWFAWQGNGIVPWQPPALGQSVELPALSMFEALMP